MTVPLSAGAVLGNALVLGPPGALASRQQMPGTPCAIAIDLRRVHGFDNEGRRGRKVVAFTGLALGAGGQACRILQEFVLGVQVNFDRGRCGGGLDWLRSGGILRRLR